MSADIFAGYGYGFLGKSCTDSTSTITTTAQTNTTKSTTKNFFDYFSNTTCSDGSVDYSSYDKDGSGVLNTSEAKDLYNIMVSGGDFDSLPEKAQSQYADLYNLQIKLQKYQTSAYDPKADKESRVFNSLMIEMTQKAIYATQDEISQTIRTDEEKKQEAFTKSTESTKSTNSTVSTISTTSTKTTKATDTVENAEKTKGFASNPIGFVWTGSDIIDNNKTNISKVPLILAPDKKDVYSDYKLFLTQNSNLPPDIRTKLSNYAASGDTIALADAMDTYKKQQEQKLQVDKMQKI